MFSPNGKLLVVGNRNDVTHVFDVASGDVVYVFDRPMTQQAVFSPDGTKLAIGYVDGKIGIWNMSTGELEKLLDSEAKEVFTLAWSSDGRFVASGGLAGPIVIWSGPHLTKLRALAKCEHQVRSSRSRRACGGGRLTVGRRAWPISAMLVRRVLLSLVSCALAACAASPPRSERIHTASLAAADGRFVSLREAFAAANPGYDLAWHAGCCALPAATADRVLFVQGPAGRGEAPTVGDVLLLRAGETWQVTSGAVDLLAFTLPVPLPADLPAVIRPDQDPRITDKPGGCADEDDAYRRIVLTWRPEVGPYVLHTLNAHRVRIRDSFTHYHPREGGFDEFYLVQQAPPGARLLTSTKVPAIEAHTVTREQVQDLVQSQPLQVGDLVYMPRGTMHRGLGGAVVQVISVPGFVPNTEIGLDHHLWAINKQLGLEGGAALPFQLVAARTAIVK
ncbi:MAG TPA: hypothetical protein VFZ65_22410 [Planctomycetota bacterium]|nr:hypothetical protein [Planctomycetota bacterium]